MVRAMAKKQRIKRACIQEVMRLKRMERRMERMKKRMRKAWGNKEEEEGSSQHPIMEDLQEMLAGVINKVVEQDEQKQRGSCQVKRNGEEHKSRNKEREVQTSVAGAQVLFHFCYQISHMLFVCEIFYNWNISSNSYS